MGLDHFILKRQLKFLIDKFNTMYHNMSESYARQVAYELQIPQSFFDDRLENQIRTHMTIILLMNYVLEEKRHEFRRFKFSSLNAACDGRFEILCFVLAHEGNISLLNAYRDNHEKRKTLLNFIYNHISENAPNAITLTFSEFENRAHSTLIGLIGNIDRIK